MIGENERRAHLSSSGQANQRCRATKWIGGDRRFVSQERQPQEL